MQPVYRKSTRGLNNLFEDHSTEGISILTAKPSKMMRSIIYLLFGLLVSGLIWSFYGKADIIVSARGAVNPESPEQPVYTPVSGELVDIYITEGMPVSKGDVLARVNSTIALEYAGREVEARFKMIETEQTYELFPVKKKAKEMELAALKSSIETAKRQHKKSISESIAKLSEEQMIKLKKARVKLDKARALRDHAKRVMNKHERLFESAGGGGVSRQMVEDKIKEYKDKALDLKLAESELGEFEVSLSKEYNKKKDEIETKSQQLLAMQAKYDTELLNLTKEEQQVEMNYKAAKAKVRNYSRVTYDDIDEDDFLRIRAPYDGIVTKVAYENVGDKVDKKPIALISQKAERKILEIAINEQDRAFLKVGMPIKIKVDAFPYQRYGFLKGKLEHVAPATSIIQQTKKVVYKARVGIERDYFTVNNVKTPLRYGMEAKAEIIVRKRRLIDIALDPFRNIKG